MFKHRTTILMSALCKSSFLEMKKHGIQPNQSAQQRTNSFDLVNETESVIPKKCRRYCRLIKDSNNLF